MARIVIHHPEYGRPVPTSFAAFGTAGGVWFIRSTLISKDGTKRYRGKKLRGPPNWVLHFTGVQPGLYYLQVSNLLGTTQAERLEVEVREHLHHGINISYPANGDTVCTVFSAYGDALNVAHVQGKMTPNTGAPVNGATLQEPPNWVISFGTLAVGPTYDCKVWDRDNPAVSQTHTGITAKNC